MDLQSQESRTCHTNMDSSRLFYLPTRYDLHSPIMASASRLLAFHKSPFFPMSFEKSSCLTSFAAMRQKAIEHLDHLVSVAWYMNSKKPAEPEDDAARVRRDIDILKAINELDLAMLLSYSHSCKVCNHDARLGGTERTSAIDFAESLINDTRHSLNDMKDISTRINNRHVQIQKMEQYLKTVAKILESVNIVLPCNDMTYSYRIDPDTGISLVIQGPDNSDPTDLLDSDSTQSLDTPVLKATRTRPPTPIPELVPAEDFTDTTTDDDTETENKAVITTTIKDKLKIPSLQIWDTPEERDAARRQHQSMGRVRFNPEPNQCPLIFSEGIYQPRGPFDDDDPETQSRMVIFSELHPETTYADLLDKVRGGPIIHAARADSTTMIVSFLNCCDAYAYANYVNDPSRRRRLKIRDVSPRVTLVETPSYPLRHSLTMAVHQGVTRCLEIPGEKLVLGSDVKSLLEARGPWAFTETPDDEDIVVNIDYTVDYNDGDVDECQYNPAIDDMFEEMMAENEPWVSVDQNKNEMRNKMELKQIRPLPPFPTLGSVIRLSFRNILQAEKAYRLIEYNFRGCGVSYIDDRCAGPLMELDIDS
ncbi:hypothetical protein EV127DRAFT_498072 [Xylaria flabelliformis]|nr:hypothetical protein EV127DRAFT_498072 [Xylaria flabelliformis]